MELRKVARISIEDVAHANRDADAVKWVAIAAASCFAVLMVGLISGYLMGKSSYQSDLAAIHKTLSTDEGKAGIRLAELGQARRLLSCDSPYWKITYGGKNDPSGSETTCTAVGISSWVISRPF